MRGGFATSFFLLSALGSTSMVAISAGSEPLGRCRVVGNEKLLAGSGSSLAICTEIERAVARAAPGAIYTAEVKVLTRSRLAASLVVNGQVLPDQHFAIMDSELNAGAIQRFAASLASLVAGASKATK